jgi:hypothetical protein
MLHVPNTRTIYTTSFSYAYTSGRSSGRYHGHLRAVLVGGPHKELPHRLPPPLHGGLLSTWRRPAGCTNLQVYRIKMTKFGTNISFFTTRFFIYFTLATKNLGLIFRPRPNARRDHAPRLARPQNIPLQIRRRQDALLPCPSSAHSAASSRDPSTGLPFSRPTLTRW